MLKHHVSLVVEDEGRNPGLSRSATDFVYQLTQPLTFHNKSLDKQYFVSIQNVRIPITFYNINSNYNTFTLTFSVSGAQTITIAEGNYTTDELISELETQIDGIVGAGLFTFDTVPITSKVTITSTGAEDITSFTSGWDILGIEDTQTLTGASTLTGNKVSFTNTMRHLRLVINNITASNSYKNDTNRSTQAQRVGLLIPIRGSRDEYQFYENKDGIPYKISTGIQSINEIIVSLIDSRGNVVDLNGVPWGFELVFSEWNRNVIVHKQERTDSYRKNNLVGEIKGGLHGSLELKRR
jgi:hypothetical protein